MRLLVGERGVRGASGLALDTLRPCRRQRQMGPSSVSYQTRERGSSPAKRPQLIIIMLEKQNRDVPAKPQAKKADVVGWQQVFIAPLSRKEPTSQHHGDAIVDRQLVNYRIAENAQDKWNGQALDRQACPFSWVIMAFYQRL